MAYLLSRSIQEQPGLPCLHSSTLLSTHLMQPPNVPHLRRGTCGCTRCRGMTRSCSPQTSNTAGKAKQVPTSVKPQESSPVLFMPGCIQSVQQAQEEAGALWAEPPGVRSGDDARPPTGKRRNDCSQRHGAGESGGGSPAAWGQRWGGNLNGQLQMESRSLSAGVGRAEPPSDGCAGTGPGKGGCPPDSEHGATRHLTAAGGDFGPPPPPCTRGLPLLQKISDCKQIHVDY